jgi:hypothetical protein
MGNMGLEPSSLIWQISRYTGEADVILSRAQRAHARPSWTERLARNARPNREPSDEPIVRRSRSLCLLTWLGDGLILV